MKSRYVPILLALISVLVLQTATAFGQKNKKVLIVVTSFSAMKDGTPMGLWLEEFATPYYELKEKGIELVIASPAGGKAPIDPKSTTPDYLTASARKFLGDAAAQSVLNNTVKLSAVNAKDFDAVFYPGGHGPMWDLPDNAKSITLIEAFVEQQKPVAFVCHAPAVLKNVKTKSGAYLVNGKTVTGYSNKEEQDGQTVNVTPFLLEDMLKERGGKFVKSETPWGPFAVQDGLLITGQNPASAAPTVQKLLTALSAK
ncbi:type 1 glutamine amidotransferase domain-containing protein [Chitinophaga rhizophila]|nr:type 1 glutamine amidotransferase domain-containing protein [Chitinophaga rhizophila]